MKRSPISSLALAGVLVLAAAPISARPGDGPGPTPRTPADLARIMVSSLPVSAPLTLVGAEAADGARRGALRLTFRNTSSAEIAGFWCQWTWGTERCPELMYTIAAPFAHREPVAAGASVDVYLQPATVRGLLRSARTKCDPGARLELDLVKVRFADGTEWSPGQRP